MIYFVQLLKVVKDKRMLAMMLNDIQWEVEELGYTGAESELISELLLSHFGVEMECPNQLDMLTKWVLNNQGLINTKAEGLVKSYNL
jgi:hypothetical protein